jgi:hypothetical protein
MRSGEALKGFADLAGQGLAMFHLMADYSRKRDYALDLDAGALTFAPDLPLGIQVLGIAAASSGDWIWGWDDSACDFDSRVLETARALRQTGMPLFTHPRIDISGQIGSDEIAMMAAVKCDALAWFVMPLQGKWQVYVVVTEDHGLLPRPGQRPVPFLLRVVRRMIESWSFADHRLPVASYLLYEQCSLAERTDRRIVAETPRGERLTALFDGEKRLASIDAGIAG